jgi:hypothetical protein
MKFFTGLVAVACVAASGAALAADPFSAALQIGTLPTIERGYTTLEDLLRQFTYQRLSEVAPSYNDNSQAFARLDLRGFNGVNLFFEQNSPVLFLHIPDLDVQQQFHGETRDESERLLEEWFKGDGREVLKRLMTHLAETSPIDPVAGNPNSLMANMAQSDFAAATSVTDTVNDAAAAAGPDGAKNFFGVSARFGQYTQGEFGASVLSVPLTYTHLFETPGWALSVDLPLTYVSNDGAKTYSGSLGLGLRVPLAHGWALIPGLRAGIVGSADLGAGGVIYSTSLTSDWRADPIGKFTLGMANMVAWYRTGSISVGDYDVGYDLSNTVLRNGLLGDYDAGFSLFEAPMDWQFAYVRTDYFGDRLYSRWSNDLSASLGTRRRYGHVVLNALRFGFTYTTGDGGISGVSGNLGYTF